MQSRGEWWRVRFCHAYLTINSDVVRAPGIVLARREDEQAALARAGSMILRRLRMSVNERVTITLPADLVRDIGRVERNRSKFLQEAARHEIERRRRALIERSLRSPHPETTQLAEAGFQEWASSLPEEDAAGLVDLQAGKEVRWVPGEGALYPMLRPGRGDLPRHPTRSPTICAP